MMTFNDIMELSSKLTIEYFEEVNKELKSYTDAMMDLNNKIDLETDSNKRFELVRQIHKLSKEQTEFYNMAMNDDKFLITFIVNKMGLA